METKRNFLKMLGLAPVVGVPAVTAGLSNKSSAQEVFKKWSEPEPEKPWAHPSNQLMIVAGAEADVSYVEKQIRNGHPDWCDRGPLPMLPRGSRPAATTSRTHEP